MSSFPHIPPIPLLIMALLSEGRSTFTVTSSAHDPTLESLVSKFFVPLKDPVTATESGTGIVSIANGTTSCYANISSVDQNTGKFTVNAIFCKSADDNKWTFMSITDDPANNRPNTVSTLIGNSFTVSRSYPTDVTGDDVPDIHTENWAKIFPSLHEYSAKYYKTKNRLKNNLDLEFDTGPWITFPPSHNRVTTVGMPGYHTTYLPPMAFLLYGKF